MGWATWFPVISSEQVGSALKQTMTISPPILSSLMSLIFTIISYETDGQASRINQHISISVDLFRQPADIISSRVFYVHSLYEHQICALYY
jgi:hypothetical protein